MTVFTYTFAYDKLNREFKITNFGLVTLYITLAAHFLHLHISKQVFLTTKCFYHFAKIV